MVEALAAQLHVAPAELVRYRKRVSTYYEQQTGIPAYPGYVTFEATQVFRLTRWP